MCHFRFNIVEQHTNVGICSSMSISSTSISSLCNDVNDKQPQRKFQFNIRCDDIYDGSYLGNPYDSQCGTHQLGFAQCRIRPAKRNTITYVLVNK